MVTWANEVRPTVRASDQLTAPLSVDAVGVATNQCRPRRNGPVNIPAASPASTSVIVLPFAGEIEDLVTRVKERSAKKIDDTYFTGKWILRSEYLVEDLRKSRKT